MPTRNLAVNTAMRYMRMLMLIPAYPGKISTSQILRRLQEDSEKYGVTQRSVQRDMELLAPEWDISFEEVGRSKYWYFNRKSSLLQIPSMSDSAALALLMAEEYLASALPATALEMLDSYFRHARDVLKDTKLGSWQKKVRLIHQGPALIPPRIRPEVHRVVYEALLEGRKIAVKYRGREGIEKSYPLSPLGMVIKNGIVYLVGVAWDMKRPATFALHRLLGAELSAEGAVVPQGFSLENYVQKDKNFAFPISPTKLKLQLRLHSDTGFHLSESRIAEDQVVWQLPGDEVRLTATADDTWELRWWLLGLGSKVVVESPASLRREIAQILQNASENYKTAKSKRQVGNTRGK